MSNLHPFLIIGMQFGDLKVLEYSHSEPKTGRIFKCGCWCGNYSLKPFSELTRKSHPSTNCGRCNLRKDFRTEYSTWTNMYYKCFNSDHEAFIDYGARGITVCTRWIASFRHFLEDMGRRPSEVHSLDRINNDGNYEKDNCRWTTIEIQLNNRRNTLPETKLGDKLLLMAKQLRERT